MPLTLFCVDHSISNKLFCYDCELDVCPVEQVKFFFVRYSFMPFNRIFIAMNQSSMAALTTKLQFDHIWWQSDKSKRRFEPLFRHDKKETREMKRKLDQLERNILSKMFAFSVSLRLNIVCFVETVSLWPASKMSEMECKQYINLVFTWFFLILFYCEWDIFCDILCVAWDSVGCSRCRRCCHCFLFYSISFLAACTVAPLAVCLYL